jgi:hypothetical protein
MCQSCQRVAIALLLAALLPIAAAAQAPSYLNHQGILTDSNGVVVPDGGYALEFGIYDAPAAGTLHFEQQLTVNVVGGLYNVLLSDNGSWVLKDAFDDPNRYLQIRIVTSPGGTYDDLTLEPRQQIASVPFAFRSGESDIPSFPPPIVARTTSASDALTCDESYTGACADLLSLTVTPPGPGYIIQVRGRVALQVQTDSATKCAVRLEDGTSTLDEMQISMQNSSYDSSFFPVMYVDPAPAPGVSITYTVDAREVNDARPCQTEASGGTPTHVLEVLMIPTIGASP